MSGIDYAASNFVDIVLCPIAKYIVVRDFSRSPLGMPYVWSSPDYKSHEQIFNAFRSRYGLYSHDLVVHGGGYLGADTNKKIIRVWGESIKYGRDRDRVATMRLIKIWYPDYEVTE